VRQAATLLAMLVAAPAGAAAPAAAPVAPVAASAAGGFVSVALSLLLILGVIVGLAWVATRLRLTPRAASSGLKVLADVAVGGKERVVLLKVGDAQALVGVGADGVRSLGLLERPVTLPAEEPPGAFASRLRALLQQAPKI
jgi:flagellar protein FliO/FliZ